MKRNSYYERAFLMIFDVVVRQDEDGYYVATVPELPGCHSQAKSLDELMSRIKEAVLLCLEEEDW